ncbi:MAG: WYL domain-containing protein [Treponema sp.]|uniref:helix-turn-helix transcriptional regulator n=1 Tax=Treponema sp. TaxID=166 RepID=UPI00298DCF78|nr:WYL domain-containing protein [Treponema sp.]MCR5386028.1 WYL domain-containing protein [Treponema sp.]
MKKNKIRKQFLSGFERILKIDYMISHMHYPSVEDFARETEASVATINRDLRDLRLKFGAEDILQYDRNEKGFYYSQPSFRIPAMLTSEKQIIAAQLMSNLLKLIKNTPIYSQAIEVFTSLSEDLDGNSKIKAKKLSNRILFLGMEPVKIDNEIWEKLEDAMSKNNYIKFNYEGYGDQKFVVQPWQLIYSQGMWSLYAYNQNPDIKDIRFYNLPGIKNLELLKETFTLPEDYEYTKRAKGNFRRYIGKELLRCKIKITSEKTLNYIKTYKWTDDQKFKKQDDGSTIMTFTSNQDYPILGWVLSHGMYVQPLEPKWLVDEWRENVKSMAKLADGV